MTYVVGITGGIGCGKSAAAKIFGELGVDVIDTDSVAQELAQPGQPAFQAISAAFPSCLAKSGELDRAALRQLVFRDPQQKHTLEAILHPPICARVVERLSSARSAYAVVVVPLLLESDAYRSMVNRVLVVDCDQQTQIARTTQRSNIAREEVEAIMAAQIGREERLRYADDVIRNESDREHLRRQVLKLHAKYSELARENGLRGMLASTSVCQNHGDAAKSCFVSGQSAVISYEHPLNERVRTLLRLEDLFAKARFFASQSDPLQHHAALISLFELLEVAARADLKTDLLQELERQRQILEPLRGNAAIAQDALQRVLREIVETSAALHDVAGKLGQSMRDNEWLMSIKQRTTIPGGLCAFDLPTYHFWLNQPETARRRDLENWLTPMQPIRAALNIVLRLLRDSGQATTQIAPQGMFQQTLSGKVAQMLHIQMSESARCVPEISANKYMINIRFFACDGQQKSRTCENDIEFALTLCTL